MTRVGSLRPTTVDHETDGWKLDANCRDTDPDVMFPIEKTSAAKVAAYARARTLCATCPVIDDCLRTALRTETGGSQHRFGMWGGHTPHERAQLAKTITEH